MAELQTSFTRLVAFIETYRGRDKIIRLVSYASYIASGLLEKLRGKGDDFNFGRLAAELSNLRVMLRLIDDLSMLQFTLSYGTGTCEKDLPCRVLQVVQNSIDQLYYPVEHIAWARDIGILKGNSEKLWTMGCFLWVASLSMGILSALRRLFLLNKRSKQENPNFQTEQESSSQQNNCCNVSEKSSGLIRQNTSLLVGLCGNVADLINGIHWLPPGYLWSGKLPVETVGFFGTLSSLCMLYNAIHPV